MKKSIYFVGMILAVISFVILPAKGEVTATFGEATVNAGTTDITVDVVLNGQTSAVRGVEANIGYDSGLLTFKSSNIVDGDWYQSRISTVSKDGTNSRTGQIKVLLAGKSDGGVPANTQVTLARLTFDLSSSAKKLLYPLNYLSSSPGFRDVNINDVTVTAIDGKIINTDAIGNINDDEEADSGDAIIILRYSVGLTMLSDAQKAAANVTSKPNNDDIDSGDAIKVLRFSVGLIDSF